MEIHCCRPGHLSNSGERVKAHLYPLEPVLPKSQFILISYRLIQPDPPSFLNADGKEEFKRIAEALNRIGVLTECDVASLAAYAQAYDRWVSAERALAACAEDTVRYSANGLLAITRTGFKANPLVKIADRAKMAMVRIAVEFGMTPSSRSRIHVNAREEENDPGEEYFKNR